MSFRPHLPFKNLNPGSCCGTGGAAAAAAACPEFSIRRYDTLPGFTVLVPDCVIVGDLRAVAAEFNLWSETCLRKELSVDGTTAYFGRGGVDQIVPGDTLLLSGGKRIEYVSALSVDDDDDTAELVRGFRGTQPAGWRRGSQVRAFRIMDGPASLEQQFEDVVSPDSMSGKPEQVAAGLHLTYHWCSADTFVVGDYRGEFKLLGLHGEVWRPVQTVWPGAIHEEYGRVYTGLTHSDASVEVQGDPTVPLDVPWAGPVHFHSDTTWTGSAHSDGSVRLYAGSIGQPPERACEPYEYPSMISGISGISGVVGQNHPAGHAGVTRLPGSVAWVRRLPSPGPGYLVRVDDSGTPDLI